MRWLRTVVVLAVAGGCALGIRALSRDESAVATGRAPLVAADAIDPEKLAQVVVEREGQRFRYEFRDGGWWQVEPIRHPVDGWSIRQLATRVLKTEAVRTVGATDEALRDVGLAPPAGRLELREQGEGGAAGRSLVIELGKRSLAGRAYARPASGEIAVIDGTLHEIVLERDPREFRRREIFPDLAAIDEAVFASGPNTVRLVRDGRAYRLESPVRTRADRVQSEEFVDALKRAKSAGFVTDSPSDLAIYGLSPASATVEVRVGSATQRLLIGDPVSIGAQDRFGMVEGTPSVVRVPATALATIIPRYERLIDATATAVRAQDIGAIDIDAAGAYLALRRGTDAWTAELGARGSAEVRKGRVSKEAVERLLGALTTARAGSVQVAAFPAERAVATIVLRGFAGEALDTVRVAREQPEGGSARTLLENGDGVLRVHGEIDLPISAAELEFAAN